MTFQALKKEHMAKNIYVGNLSYGTREEQLSELFANHGEVASVKIILDRETGKSKGFGFVEMKSDDSVDAAIAALDGAEFLGRKLRVNMAQERAPRPRGSFGE
jgi:RNA recognition motif-containing protein